MGHILQLSAELLLEIFSSLFFTDVLRCKQTCRTILDVVSNSVQLTYQIELQKAGMLDNPHCSLPLVHKVQMLKDRELAWATLDHKFISTVRVPYPPSGLHDVTPDVFLLGREIPDEEFATDGLQSTRLPSREDEVVSAEWNQFDLGMKILDFRPAIEDHDMIVFVVMVPDEDRPGWLMVKAILRQHSNPDQAPAGALKPELPLCAVEDNDNEPEVNMEISGENLAIVIGFREDDLRLIIFDWKTGKVKSSPNGNIMLCNKSIVFLREDVLLHACPDTHSILLFEIQQTRNEAGTEPVIDLFFILGMPPLGPQSKCSGISVRSNPVSASRLNFPKYTASTRPFINDSMSSIILFSLEITSETDNSLTNWVMVVHRKTFLDLLAIKTWELKGFEGQGKDESKSRLRLSWEHWGPFRTRWFKIDPFCADFTMNCSGQRYIQLTNPATESEDLDGGNRHNTIHLFDFNPFHVNFMAQHGLRLLAQRRSVVLNVVGAGNDRPWNSSLGFKENTLDTEGVFKIPLEGYLPYVELITDTGTDIDYDGLFIDEERLIGIRTEQDTYQMKSMDAIYFG